MTAVTLVSGVAWGAGAVSNCTSVAAALAPLPRPLERSRDRGAARVVVGSRFAQLLALRLLACLHGREPLLAPAEALVGRSRERVAALVRRERALRAAEAFRQHDLARADDVAAAALDAIVEAERGQRVEVRRLRRDQELLRLEPCGASHRAF